ncbi:MAG: 50S ribosomal protein L35ae [Candidatus Nanoarchaeia archaeon]|nr:50S ribosomal protein L35ae [Candidatus Nanoarchaeia archaeon]
MEATITSFRTGRHTQKNHQMIINLKSVDNREKADKLVGKMVLWKSPKGKEIKGEIKAAHGNKGSLRVLFEKGLPGQSIGNKIEVM